MKKILLIVALFIMAQCTLRAQEPQNIAPVLADIIESYAPWTSVQFEGKVRTDKLPIAPNLKMYFVCDSIVQMSVRVPLLGEVGRLNLTKDEILIVNKMKRTYVQEDASKFFEMYPSALKDLQSILLARVVILGGGELDAQNAVTVDVESDGRGSWLLLPDTDTDELPFSYGYLVGSNSRTLALTGALSDKGTLEIQYSYKNRGMQMECTLDTGKKQTQVELDFSTVKWGGSEMAMPKLDGYTKMGFKEFINNLK